MTTTIRKGLIGKEDVRFYTAASPTFTRITSYGSATPMTAMAATHIPTVQATASRYFSANNVQRALNEIVSRYIGPEHSLATYGGGADVGDHVVVFGFRNALAATSIQAAASNSFLRDGVARVVIPRGTYTVATPIQLPRKCIIFGNGHSTVIRASSTIQTSRIFTFAGSVGATSQSFTAFAAQATQVTVANGAQFVRDTWIQFTSATRQELKQVRAIAGNNLSLYTPTRRAFSTGTVKIIYPAEVEIDNMNLVITSATQGRGVSATNVVDSYFGPNLKIVGSFGDRAINIAASENCSFEMDIKNALHGLWLDNTGNAEISGRRRRVFNADSARINSSNNFIFGRQMDGQTQTTGAGISDFEKAFYRSNKPELSYASYSVSGTATTVVTLPASTTAPAEVIIADKRYKNQGTILCDLSRTKTPANATVGGMDRGPAVATRPFYIYAVPTQLPSATRQFDLMASSSAPSSGPTASATFPNWSFLGYVSTAATVRVVPFVQVGDKFDFSHIGHTLLSNNSVSPAQATYRVYVSSVLPAVAKELKMEVELSRAGIASAGGYYMQFARSTEVNTNRWQHIVYSGGVSGGGGLTVHPRGFDSFWQELTSGRFAWLTSGAATIDQRVRYFGASIPRNQYQ